MSNTDFRETAVSPGRRSPDMNASPIGAQCCAALSPPALRPPWRAFQRCRRVQRRTRSSPSWRLTAAAVTVDAALEELTSTPPTTPAGMRVVIEYLVELDSHADYLPTLLRSSMLRSPLLAG